MYFFLSFVVPEKQLVGAPFDVRIASFKEKLLGPQDDKCFILIVFKCAVTAGISNSVNI